MNIYNNREIVGEANTPAQAIRILRGLLQGIPAGWKISVRQRNTDIIDLPAGWVYSVHP